MNAPDVLSFLETRVLPIVQIAIASGVVKTSTGTEVTKILGDINAVIKDSNPLTPAVLTDATTLVNDLTGQQIIGGKAIAETEAALAKYQALVADVHMKPPQTIIFDDKASFAGVPGLVMFAPLGSEQATSVGY